MCSSCLKRDIHTVCILKIHGKHEFLTTCLLDLKSKKQPSLSSGVRQVASDVSQPVLVTS